jgi:2-C-methyl-D-erythritol 4-phosphate cytidylyltransferase
VDVEADSGPRQDDWAHEARLCRAYSEAVPRAAVLVLAGGSGSRVGAGVNKVYLSLAGRSVLSWSLAWAAQVPEIVTTVLVVRAEDVPLAGDVLRREAADLDVRMVVGGATRHRSEDAGLAEVAAQVDSGELDVIAVHDGARPLAGASLFRTVIRVADAAGGAVPALSATGVLQVGKDGQPQPGGSTSPHRLARVQTPQAFRAKDLLTAYAAAQVSGYEGTDTASSVEAFSGIVVRTVAGSPLNLKVTYLQDLAVAERLLTAHRRHFC